MVNFKYAVIAVPTQQDYNKLESFVCDIFKRGFMFTQNVWPRRSADTCVRIVVSDNYVDFGYSERRYYEYGNGMGYVRESPPELQLCNVDEFIAYATGANLVSIDNETLVSLL